MAVEIKVINKSNNELPHYATAGAAGMDIRANIESEIVLAPLQRMLVPTGIFMEIPEGYEVQVRPRSGLAFKNGITCLNTPGTIDSDYRGEIKVLLINLSNEAQTINHNDRIAQLIIAKYETAKLQVVNELNETVRAAGGFGHTGV
jgi:dUTP pyrophosphatase